MSDPDITPTHGTPISSAAPEPARARGGHHAPRVEGGTLPPVPAEVEAVLDRARALFRAARNPRADAAWPDLKAHLIAARVHLAARGDGAYLTEIDRYLGTRA